MLITNAIDNFLLYLKALGRRQKTLHTYQTRLQWFMDSIPYAQLGKIKVEDIDRWAAGMRDSDLAEATVNSRIRDVRSFFKWCASRNYIERSPASHLKVKKIESDEIKAISPEDLEKLLEHCLNDRDRAIVRFLTSSGCRSGEAASLKRAELNLDKCEAKIRGKTGSRDVDFDEPTALALKQWLNQAPDHTHVFMTLDKHKQPMTNRTIGQMFNRLAARAGIEERRHNPHSVRHLVGQTWADNVNVELVRKKLGHRCIESTLVYVNQDRSRVKKLTNELAIL